MENCGGSGSCGLTCFPELASLVVHLTVRENVGDFCDSESHEGFATLTRVGSQVVYVAVVDPNSVRFVSGRVSHLAGRQETWVAEASVGLSMPVSGFTKSNTLCIISALSDAMIESGIRIQGMSTIVVQSTPRGLGSKERLWGRAEAVVRRSPCSGGTRTIIVERHDGRGEGGKMISECGDGEIR